MAERYQFYSDGSVFFVTFSIVEWLPVFVSEAPCQIITDSLKFCRKSKGLRVNAWVVMPTHFHAILFHESFRAAELESVVTHFRKFTGRRLSDYCEKHAPSCFSDTFRAAAGKDRNRRFWQPTRHPVLIKTERFWRTKIDYLHENPCRKGLVIRAEQWKYSSAGFWLSDGADEGPVPIDAIEW